MVSPPAGLPNTNSQATSTSNSSQLIISRISEFIKVASKYLISHSMFKPRREYYYGYLYDKLLEKRDIPAAEVTTSYSNVEDLKVTHQRIIPKIPDVECELKSIIDLFEKIYNIYKSSDQVDQGCIDGRKFIYSLILICIYHRYIIGNKLPVVYNNNQNQRSKLQQLFNANNNTPQISRRRRKG